MSIIALVAAEEHNLLLPALPDLIWGTVSFIILLVLFSKFILPTMNKVLAERAEKIQGGLARAEAAQAEAAQAKSDYTSALAAARSEAAQIRATAEEQSRHQIEAAKAEAQSEAQAIQARNREALTAERAAASVDLQKQIGALALDLAGRVVGESLNDDARSRAVVDAFIADLERQAAEAGR